jgi:hypothetical protein
MHCRDAPFRGGDSRQSAGSEHEVGVGMVRGIASRCRPVLRERLAIRKMRS